MTTKLKLRGVAGSASGSLDPHIPGIYGNPNARLLALVELEHVERTTPAPWSDTDPSVTVRISQIEVPGPAHEDTLRDLLRALWLVRTVPGTFDEISGRVQIDEAQAKIAGAPALIMSGDAIDARFMLRQVREHLSILATAGPATTERQRTKKLNALHDMVDAFLQTGTRDPHLGQAELDLRTASGVWTADGPVDVTSGELAGQDVGTRVPAPEDEPERPRDPSEPDHEAPEAVTHG